MGFTCDDTTRYVLNMYTPRTLLLSATAAVAILVQAVTAQTMPSPAYKFEVISIKSTKNTAQNTRIAPGPNGGIRTQNTNVMMLLAFAYNCPEFQFVNAPSWTHSDAFDITATPDHPEEAPGPKPSRSAMQDLVDRQRQRMQSLLIERFGLVLRRETREMPIYALTVDKGGVKITESPEGPTSLQMPTGRPRLLGKGVSMPMLAGTLSNVLLRPIVDETGLKGRYDLQLEWSPDSSPNPDGAQSDLGPSLFTAIREQAGLRLESKKGPGPVFVIDKISKPDEN